MLRTRNLVICLSVVILCLEGVAPGRLRWNGQTQEWERGGESARRLPADLIAVPKPPPPAAGAEGSSNQNGDGPQSPYPRPDPLPVPQAAPAPVLLMGDASSYDLVLMADVWLLSVMDDPVDCAIYCVQSSGTGLGFGLCMIECTTEELEVVLWF